MKCHNFVRNLRKKIFERISCSESKLDGMIPKRNTFHNTGQIYIWSQLHTTEPDCKYTEYTHPTGHCTQWNLLVKRSETIFIVKIIWFTLSEAVHSVNTKISYFSTLGIQAYCNDPYHWHNSINLYSNEAIPCVHSDRIVHFASLFFIHNVCKQIYISECIWY
jgi:hypothetical protein